MSAVASTSQQPYAYAGKDAAAKEREDRLLAAKKKLKLYRARTNARMSGVSAYSDASMTTSSPSPTKAARRRSGLSGSVTSAADFAAKHAHRRSQSKSGLLAAMGGDSLVAASGIGGAASPGHARRASKSRMSRSSISLKKMGHGHTRSRASISMSFSGPAPQLAAPPTESPRSVSPAQRPPSWLHGGGGGGVGGFPGSPEASRSTFSSPTFAPHSAPARPISPLPPAPAPGPPPKHGRNSSRHARHSSVTNFRESLDIVSAGTLHDPTLLRPSISSFADAQHSSPSASPLAPVGWSTDPHQVLAALKERGRRESDDPTRSPAETRQSALEALEGRLAAPTEMISLGDEEPGELITAPRSPGMTSDGEPIASAVASPVPQPPSSAMVGLGVAGSQGIGSPLVNKRSSWGSTLGGHGASAAAQHSVMELGEIAEEDEEEDDASLQGGSPRRRTSRGSRAGARTPTPVSSPQGTTASARASPSPRKPRPGSIFAPAPEARAGSLESVLEHAEHQQQQQQGGFRQRDFALGRTPSPVASRRSSMRPLSLSASSVTSSAGTPSTAGMPDDVRASSSPEEKHISMFHSAAVSGYKPEPLVSPSPSSTSALASQPVKGGLRSLSIGSGAVGASPTHTPERRFSAQSALGHGPSSTPSRKVSPAPTMKRSSISYRTSTSSVSSLAGVTPEGQKRAWRSSLIAAQQQRGEGSPSPSPSPAPSTAQYSTFPAGVMGSFGDLEVSGDFAAPLSPIHSPAHSRMASASAAGDPAAEAALAAAQDELATLRSRLEQLEARNEQLVSTHALEIAEFEKKASDEAREMRSRTADLEQQLDDERVARRFEVEGLQREADMAKEAISDLTDERDSLREDVDGWRERCVGLDAQVKKDREDEALAQAQAKLIGEMRDQIYTLVAALERERSEHAETRKEVERVLEDRVREAANDMRPMHLHQHQQRGSSASSSSLGSAIAPPPRSSRPQQPFAPQQQQQPSHAASLSASSATSSTGPSTHKQPRADDLALIMEEVEEDDGLDEGAVHDQPQQHQVDERVGGAVGRRHPFKEASDGSMLSGPPSSYGRSYSGATTSSSFGQSYQSYSGGNTTEETSDLDDSFSAKFASPPNGSPFPPPASARDSVAIALGQLDTLAEEEEEEEDRDSRFGGPAQAPAPLAENNEPRTRLSSDSTTSTSSDVMPRTPDKARVERHDRSHSFVRTWSFPKGSISSTRNSFDEEDSSFFGYNKHSSLPPLPIGDNILPPFLSSTLDIDEASFSFFPKSTEGTVETASHMRRPSSPRPLDRVNPHARRLSGQHRPPPPSPSALVTAAIQQQQQQAAHASRLSQASSAGSQGPSPTKSRYSFGALVGSLGGWSSSSSSSQSLPPSLPAPASSKLARQSLGASVSAPGPLILEEDEDGDNAAGGHEEDVYVGGSAGAGAGGGSGACGGAPGGTPVQLQHQNQHQHRLRAIRPHEVPAPRAGRLAKLDFRGSACCVDRPVFVV